MAYPRYPKGLNSLSTLSVWIQLIIHIIQKPNKLSASSIWWIFVIHFIQMGLNGLFVLSESTLTIWLQFIIHVIRKPKKITRVIYSSKFLLLFFPKALNRLSTLSKLQLWIRTSAFFTRKWGTWRSIFVFIVAFREEMEQFSVFEEVGG